MSHITLLIFFIIMSPDPYFTSFLFREHNSATVRNILISELYIIIEQINMECRLQE